MRKLVAILLAASALTGVALDAAAKGPKPARPRIHLGPGITHHHGQPAPANLLSRSELQWCVDKQGPLDTADAAIATEEANLEARAAAVDTYSQSSVSAYNALVDAFNARVRANNVAIDDWNSRCANRSYYVSDMNAVRGK
jgi:hypothetical protein